MPLKRGILAIAITLIVSSSAFALDRFVWRHAGGHFENTVGNRWVEKSPDGTFYFNEVRRAPGFVELYDGSRDCYVRLTADHCYVKFGGGGYRRFYDGGWER
jgi:hypothetical protein